MNRQIVFVIAIIILTPTIFAEETKKVGDSGAELSDEDKGKLARATQNPIADLISVPFQWNVGFKSGPDDDRTGSVLNVQPVISMLTNSAPAL